MPPGFFRNRKEGMYDFPSYETKKRLYSGGFSKVQLHVRNRMRIPDFNLLIYIL